MVITLVNDIFWIHNHGTTISAMQFAKASVEREHTL